MGRLTDGEGPVREVDVSAFWIDPQVVTTRQFAEFIESTGYRTEAETFRLTASRDGCWDSAGRSGLTT
ncbi:MAG: SUMF1/EgtB/PvdO family nonheme iron enzyme [Propionibacteriaceae bacterium]|nr:SUMF1/EgtB/PvdO family nonheme iron enzyme [Propionibacteriaceae bacterium]